MASVVQPYTVVESFVSTGFHLFRVAGVQSCRGQVDQEGEEQKRFHMYLRISVDPLNRAK